MPATPPSLDAHIIPTASPSDIPASLLPLLTILSSAYQTLSSLFYRLPGSAILVRYIKSSHQNDPYRSLLEVLLFAFAIRTLLKGRTRGDGAGKTFIKFTEKEIDELVDEWQPLPLCDEAEGEMDATMLETVPIIQGPNGIRVKLANGNGKVVLNMGAPDWCGFTENEKMKSVAIETLKVYGVGSCGPSGFYGTIGMFNCGLSAFTATLTGYKTFILTWSAISPHF
jgi:serine palmitoyltransferase